MAAQRCREPSGNQSVDELDARQVAGIGHHLDQRAVERQRALLLGKRIEAGAVQQFRLSCVRPLRVCGVDAIHILDDGQAGSAERVGDQEGAGVGPMRWDARGREFMVVIGRKGAADHGARAVRWIASWLAMVGCSI